MLTEHKWVIICCWESTSTRLISQHLYQIIRLIVVDNPFQLELPFCLLLISTKLHSGSPAGWSTSRCLGVWASAAAWRVSPAVLTSGSSSPKRTAPTQLLHRAWSVWASLLACWSPSCCCHFSAVCRVCSLGEWFFHRFCGVYIRSHFLMRPIP